EVLWVDRYGNCQINIGPDEIDGWGDRIRLRWTRPRPGTRVAVRARAFDDLEAGQVGLVTDSYGLLAVTLARGSAADLLDLAAGEEITLAPVSAGGEGDAGAPPGGEARTDVAVDAPIGGRGDPASGDPARGDQTPGDPPRPDPGRPGDPVA